METTIEQQFGSALRFCESIYKNSEGKSRGFQVRVSSEANVASPNINEMMRKDKGASEARRKAVFLAALKITPSLPAKTYESFLSLGQWILDGKKPEEWKPAVVVLRGVGTLRVGKPDQATDSPPPEPEPSVGPSTREIHRIPVISWIRAGNWCEVEDPFHPGDADEWVDTTATKHPNAFALVVTGDSMEPLFHEGETIIVDPGREVINGSYVVAKNGDNEATFKQFVTDGSSVFLKPLNQRYPIKDMTGVKFIIVGVVVAKEMRF